MALLCLLPRALSPFHAFPTPGQYVASPSKSRPADVPLEIVMTILEHMYYSDNLEVDTTVLKSCSLICRTWSLAAQKLLFRCATLQNQKVLESFLDAIDRSTERGRILGDAVKYLHIIMDYNQPLGIHQHAFALCVSMCPGLTGLSISLYGCAAPGMDLVGLPDESRMKRPAPLFDEQTIQLLTSGPKITAFDFSNWSDNEQTTTQLLQVWPSLKSLSISGTVPQLAAIPSDPPPCALERLRLNFQTSPSNDYMSWLLHNSAESLCVLEFDREPSSEMLECLLINHGSTLLSLSLPSLSSPEQASAIQKCSQLRELRTEKPSVLPIAYRRLPESLEHMAFGIDKDSVLHAVLDAVKSKTSLTKITVLVWAGGDSHHQLSKLKIGCAWQGVDLTMTSDIRLFRLMTRKAC